MTYYSETYCHIHEDKFNLFDLKIFNSFLCVTLRACTSLPFSSRIPLCVGLPPLYN